MTLSVLIIGCGAIAGGYDENRPDGAGPLTHAGAFSRDGRFSMAACVDPDAMKRQAFARRWKIEQSFADIVDAKGTYNVISVCSPTALHGAHLQAALALKPRLIFCEKPVTYDLDEARRLVAACAEARVLLAVNHTRRWDPAVARLKQELASGQWGAVRAAQGVYNKGVLNNASHMVDLLQFLLGRFELVAAGEPVWDFWDNDPTVPAILSGPVPVTLGVAHAADYALFELSLITERGVVTMEEGGGAWRIRSAIDSPTFSGYRTLERGDWRAGTYDRAMTAAVAEIHAVLTGGGALSSTGQTALEAQALCAAIRDAALAREPRNRE